jgi:hypothetical protein
LVILQGSASKDLKNAEPPTKVKTVVEIPEEHEHTTIPKDIPAEISQSGNRFVCPELPLSLEFCGEKVPLSDHNVKERLDRELLVNMFWHSSTMLMFKRAHRFFPEIEKILAQEGVPDDFKYLAMAESGLVPTQSSAGAQGVWQFIEATAKRYNLEIRSDVDERYHLEKSTRAACKYLKDAKAKFGSWTLAAAAYNRGEGGLDRALESQLVSSYYDLYLNSETSRYVFRIISLKEIHTNQEKYGFIIDDNLLYNPLHTYQKVVNYSIKSLPQFAREHGTTYKIIRELNPWLNSYSLANSSGTSYSITLPYLLSERMDEKK